MTTVTIEEAQAQLPQLINGLIPGQELVITRDDRPIAKLVGEPAALPQARQPGSAIGKLVILKEDDEHLDDFKEYMP